MQSQKIPVYGLCPFRSPLVPPKPEEISPIARLAGAPAPEMTQPAIQLLGPCLYAGCGLWKITKVEGNVPVDGMCSLRFIADAFGSIAQAVAGLAQLQMPAAKG